MTEPANVNVEAEVEAQMLRSETLTMKLTELLNEELRSNPSKDAGIVSVLSALTTVAATTTLALRVQPMVFAERYLDTCGRAYEQLKAAAEAAKKKS